MNECQFSAQVGIFKLDFQSCARAENIDRRGLINRDCSQSIIVPAQLILRYTTIVCPLPPSLPSILLLISASASRLIR